MKKASLSTKKGDVCYSENRMYILNSGKDTFVVADITDGRVWMTFFDENGTQHARVQKNPWDTTVGIGTRKAAPPVATCESCNMELLRSGDCPSGC